ncbi:MAG: hypothetical protein CMJ78_14055 [Planctomycetaceae bacterium]|nr:hypothetical protein [Planctomycetaceae bacterium]
MFVVIVAACWIAVQYGHPIGPGLKLEFLFKFKIGATGIVLLSFPIFDVPRYLEFRNASSPVVRASRILGRAILVFVLYTLSFGIWVFIDSRWPLPFAIGELIHNSFYAPLHWLSSQFLPYAYVICELFWLGHGPV